MFVYSPLVYRMWLRGVTYAHLCDLHAKRDSLPPAYRKVLDDEYAYRTPRWWSHGGGAEA